MKFPDKKKPFGPKSISQKSIGQKSVSQKSLGQKSAGPKAFSQNSAFKSTYRPNQQFLQKKQYLSKDLLAKDPILPKTQLAGGQSLIYGKHPVLAALLNPDRQIFRVFVTKNNQEEFDLFIAKNNIDIGKKLVAIVSNEEIEVNFSGKVVHQVFAMLFSSLKMISDNEFLAQISKQKSKNNLAPIIIMDQLTDPHNIGAIIRSSVAFGVSNIVLLKQNFGGETATIGKSSSGAIEKANIILAGNLNNFILNLKDLGYWIAGLDGSGQSDIEEVKKYPNICLVIGSEGDGIRHLVKRNCDLLLKIPISSEVESLNASNAAAIALYEISKKNINHEL